MPNHFNTVPFPQEGSCIVTGISYNGVDRSSGGVDWYGLANVHLIRHEMGLTLQVVPL